jgi:digeranylgeranylglycerophospholipid reductase
VGGKGEEALSVQENYDVIVVGAGPAGLTAATRLSEQGWNVGVAEEHAQIGSPVNCSGVLGVEAFERFQLPSELIRHSLSNLEFVSPRGLRWEFETANDLAHVVVRGEFDRYLGERARAAGASVLLGHRVTSVDPAFGGVELGVSDGDSAPRSLRCRAVVVATGAGMPLLKKLGFNDVPSRLLGVQTEIELPVRRVEVYFGQKWAPEGFAWVVPLGDGRAKVGLLCRRDGPNTLRRFLARPDLSERTTGVPGPIQCSVLPLGFLRQSFAERILVVGEAAGHIKTTTCGGIYYGMRTAELAAEVLDSSLASDRLDSATLSSYEHRWRALLQREIETGLKLRRSFKLMSDWGVERLMSLARRDAVARLIRDEANFDWHRGLIDAVFRHGAVSRILGAA